VRAPRNYSLQQPRNSVSISTLPCKICEYLKMAVSSHQLWVLAASVLVLSLCVAADHGGNACPDNFAAPLPISTSDAFLNNSDTTVAYNISGDRRSLAVLWANPGVYRSANVSIPRNGATMYPPVRVKCCATINVAWYSPPTPRAHNLWKVTDEAAANCTSPLSPTGTWLTTPNPFRTLLINGTFNATLSAAAPATYALVNHLTVNGDFWLVCSLGPHCATFGLKLKITVEGCPEPEHQGEGGYGRKLKEEPSTSGRSLMSVLMGWWHAKSVEA
jgi:hypothetical protein